MEEIIYTEEKEKSRDTLHLDPVGRDLLQGAAKWAKFIAIVSFVFCGIIALLALTAGLWFGAARSSMSAASDAMGIFSMGSGVFTAMYLFYAGIYFIFAFYLYRFADKALRALTIQDGAALNESLGALNSYFRIQGVLLIVALAFLALAVVLVFVGTIIAGLAF